MAFYNFVVSVSSQCGR